MSDTTYSQLFHLLEPFEQTHLLKYWHELSSMEQSALAEDIAALDLPEVVAYYKQVTASMKNGVEKFDDRMEVIPSSIIESTVTMSKERLKMYEHRGLEEISKGHVGVLLMAGGQATRLAYPYPKGMFDVGIPSHKPLFQIQAERILKLQQIAKGKFCSTDAVITWYIMTSQHTMDQSEQFFRQNNYFGLDRKNVIFFEQNQLPCFDFDGKILLDQKYHVSQSPDGNGGIYRALEDNGILSDLKSRKIKYLHAHSVDNILIRVADPVFVGYCAINNGDCVAKACPKSSPTEAVGAICQVDGKFQVVEYSEIMSETAHALNDDGTLKFKYGNICNHLFTTEFLERIALKHEKNLKLHVAKKKIPCVNENGVRVTPNEPNGIKMEKFVFDVFEFAQNFLVLEVARDEEFSALKNQSGKDSATTARQDLFRLHKKYIERAGGKVNGDVCEISPLLSYAGENLRDRCEDVVFNEPVLLSAKEESMLINNNNNK